MKPSALLRIALVFLLILLVFDSVAQNRNDSLFQASGDALIKQMSTDLPNAIKEAKDMVFFSDTARFEKFIDAQFKSRQLLAIAFGRMQELDSAEFWNLECLKWAKENKANSSVWSTLFNLASNSYSRGYELTTQDYLDSLLSISLSEDEEATFLAQTKMKTFQSKIFRENGEFALATVYAQQALKALPAYASNPINTHEVRKRIITQQKANSLDALGSAFRLLGILDSSEAAYSRAQTQAVLGGRKDYQLSIGTNQVKLYSSTNQLGKLKSTLSKIRLIAREYGSKSILLDYKLTELDYLVVSGKTALALDSLQAFLPKVNPAEQSPNWLSSFYLLASNIYQKKWKS